MKSKPSSNKRKIILVVEDEKILREAYCRILTQEGYDVRQANTGSEALKILKNVRPDLILLDIVMPNIDGLEFLQQAGIANKLLDTKVIAFSNLSDQQKLDLMIKLGVSQNILKSSLSPKQLAGTVKQLLS